MLDEKGQLRSRKELLTRSPQMVIRDHVRNLCKKRMVDFQAFEPEMF